MPELTWPLPCIVCGHIPEPVFPDDPKQPYGATVFTSHGQYGSTVFDETGRQFLKINVCDRCLRQKAETNVIALGAKIFQPTEYEYEPWRPYDPEGDDEEEVP